MLQHKTHYSIGELCDEFSVTARALRFYEDEALIAPERRGTQRLYTERDRARLAWILRGKRVGLSLADIKELLDLYDIGDNRRTQRLKTIERCQGQVDNLKRQRVDIDATIKELEGFIALVKSQTAETLDTGEVTAMPVYSAPIRDTKYVLDHVVGIQNYSNLPGFADATPDLVEAILTEGARFCEEVLQPLNRVGDEEGCKRLDDGSVTTPPGFKEAWDQFVAGGWTTLHAPQEYGGQGLPSVVATAIAEYLGSANHSFEMYNGLTQGAIASLLVKGSDEIKAKYVPKMVSGQWTGTMNLTEPHCGTDLGLLKTKADPNPDGSYSITGTKIFISSGEHDLVGEHHSSRAGKDRGRS